MHAKREVRGPLLGAFDRARDTGVIASNGRNPDTDEDRRLS